MLSSSAFQAPRGWLRKPVYWASVQSRSHILNRVLSGGHPRVARPVRPCGRRAREDLKRKKYKKMTAVIIIPFTVNWLQTIYINWPETEKTRVCSALGRWWCLRIVVCVWRLTRPNSIPQINSGWKEHGACVIGFCVLLCSLLFTSHWSTESSKGSFW